MTSETAARSREFVRERLPEARGLAAALADLIDDPEAFVAVLREGLGRLSDEAYADEVRRLAPTGDGVIGVPSGLLGTIERGLRGPLHESSSSSALWLAQRLAAEPERETRLFALLPLRRALPADPERSWQVLRRLARAARDSMSVDSIAEVFAEGVLLEPFRWAEVEQLAYSTSRWERRLIGSTLARLPLQVPASQWPALAQRPALTLIKSVVGDADEQVQNSLAWALREWTKVDAQAVGRLLEEEAQLAIATNDGHRARVIRDALPALPSLAPRLRQQLGGVRRDAQAPSTSRAAEVARSFAAGGIVELSEQAVRMQGERQGLGRRGA